MIFDRSKVKILVVDDAFFIRKVLKDILNEIGYSNIIEASNGLEAVETYKKEKPNLVTLDINMPKMDGIQALKNLKRLDPKARVIMVTSVEQKHIVHDAIKLGAKDYIVKPFNRSMIGVIIDRVARSS
ncbi:MAG: response regulator [Candidatus Nitrosocaldaceae archaeon]|nr:MAG: response regulator [Candidatus Nitrosocaldaceae archaeon]